MAKRLFVWLATVVTDTHFEHTQIGIRTMVKVARRNHVSPTAKGMISHRKKQIILRIACAKLGLG